MRNDIVNIVNKLALKAGLNINLIKMYDIIFNYCKENKKRPYSNNYDLINGCLYINNDYIRRVEPLKSKFYINDLESYVIEGKILAKSELID